MNPSVYHFFNVFPNTYQIPSIEFISYSPYPTVSKYDIAIHMLKNSHSLSHTKICLTCYTLHNIKIQTTLYHKVSFWVLFQLFYSSMVTLLVRIILICIHYDILMPCQTCNCFLFCSLQYHQKLSSLILYFQTNPPDGTIYTPHRQ